MRPTSSTSCHRASIRPSAPNAPPSSAQFCAIVSRPRPPPFSLPGHSYWAGNYTGNFKITGDNFVLTGDNNTDNFVSNFEVPNKDNCTLDK